MRACTRANLIRRAAGEVATILTRECAHKRTPGVRGAAVQAQRCTCRRKAVEEIVDLLEHACGAPLTEGERDVVYGRTP